MARAPFREVILLGSLLPGVREIRAPLAAGYLWLVVAWILLERWVPDRGEATGVAASLYRASDVFSNIGLAVVISFATYLVGSLSSSLLTPALRRFFPGAAHGSADDSRHPTATPRSPLSPQARAALGQIVRTSHEKLTLSLALTDWKLDAFLRSRMSGSMYAPTSRRRLPRRRRITWSPRRRSKQLVMGDDVGPGYAPPVKIEPTPAALLTRAVLDDLDVVATTRLLGRDQELYAEVDRYRSGVELRLAIIPPLLALAITFGAKSDPWLFALLASIGAIFAWGLFADAVRSERVANQTLLQSIEDRRVQSPTLERWETEAAKQARQIRPELLQPTAEDAVVALRRAAASLEDVGRSEPSWAAYARRQVDLAEEPMTHVTQLFPQPVVESGQAALGLLTEIADDWVAIIEGHGPPREDPHERLARAQLAITEFQGRAREAVRSAVASDALSAQEPHRPEPAS